MRVMKTRNFVVYGLVALSGVALLHTSQNVQRAEERRDELKRSIEREREQIEMLQAEWVYLNRPERLERLAEEFLDLSPPDTQKLITSKDAVFYDKPTSGIEQGEAASAQDVSYQAPRPSSRIQIEIKKPAEPKSYEPQISAQDEPVVEELADEVSDLETSKENEQAEPVRDFGALLQGLTSESEGGAQ